MHNTSITVKSVVGQGSSFSFGLPLATPEQITQTGGRPVIVQESTVKVLEPETWDETLNQTILLIDDDASTRLMLHRIFEAAGYIMLDASDGTQGLDLATGILPDLIVLDLILPDMSGWDLIEKLRGEPSTAGIPIIILSNALNKEKAAQFDISLALDKTIDPSDLLAHIQRLLTHQLPTSGD
jgi:CheY-like chemotaxis protein